MKLISKLDLYEMMEIIFCAEYDDDVDIEDAVEEVYGKVVDNWNDEYGRSNWEFENEYRLDTEDFLNWWKQQT